ncbi:MAG: chalcone isomerase family protein [Pseudomonadota bacterium]
MKPCIRWGLVMVMVLAVTAPAIAGDMTIADVKFPGEKIVDGKTLLLNGVGLRKKFGFVKVFAGGFYLERPTSSPEEAIASDQVKQFYLHYLTSKATAPKLQEGFIEAIEEANPPELVKAQQANIKLYASWLDKDMADGKTSVTTYVPGKGLTLVFQGEEKGTITDPDFIRMYFTYNFGEKADRGMRDGYLKK